MCIKRLTVVLLATIVMTGCSFQTGGDENIPQAETETRAISDWFSGSVTDEDEFTDKKDYQYYARTIGLDKDALLAPNMWEIFYSEELNINREIDEKAIYLIRLDPEKLLEIYAENNACTTDKICKELSATAEQLYYNWGYTAAAVNYGKNHPDGTVAYSDKEARIFGADNGENRQVVMSTHFLIVDTTDNTVTYSSEMPELEVRRSDLLRSTTKATYNYAEYTEEEKNPAFSVNGIGIRRVLPLSVPNGWKAAEDKEITVMFNASPFSYGCTDKDKVFTKNETEVEE